MYVILRHIHVKIVAVQNDIYIYIYAYSECVSKAVGIQHVMHMRSSIFSSVAWLYHIFPHYLIKDTIFGKKSSY
jgi:hypothetical protein